MATPKRHWWKEAQCVGNCDFILWRLRQAGGLFLQGADPRKHAGVWLNQLSHKLAALRLTPEGGFATWLWSADQSPLLSPSCAGN